VSFSGDFWGFWVANIGQDDEQVKIGKKDVEKEERKPLTGIEVERLLAATKGTRNEARDRCLMAQI
jgi:hypothetical protein